MNRQPLTRLLLPPLIAALACSDPNLTTTMGLQFSPKPLLVQRLDTARLYAVIVNVDGDTVGGHTIVYRPQDPTMLSVDQFGLVRSLGPVGSTYIYLSEGQNHLFDSAFVVVSTTPSAIAISPMDTAIPRDGFVSFAVTVYDSSGTVPRQPFTVTIPSADRILAYDSGGLLHSLGVIGEDIVTVTSGTVSAHAAVTVDDTISAGRITASGHPNVVAIDSRGNGLITRSGAPLITQYNTATRTPEASLYSPIGITDMTLDSAGDRAYVIASLAVYGVDVSSGAITDTVHSASQPLAVVVSPDDTTLWASEVGDVLSVYARHTRRLLKALPVSTLSHLTAGPPGDSLLYGSVGGQVIELNCHQLSVGRTFAVGGSITSMAVTADGATLFAADATGHRVMVLDLTSGVPTDSISLPAPPLALATARDGAQLWVTLPSLGEAMVFDPTTHASLKTVTTSGSPRGVGVGPTGTVVLIANDSGWVDVIPR